MSEVEAGPAASTGPAQPTRVPAARPTKPQGPGRHRGDPLPRIPPQGGVIVL